MSASTVVRKLYLSLLALLLVLGGGFVLVYGVMLLHDHVVVTADFKCSEQWMVKRPITEADVEDLLKEEPTTERERELAEYRRLKTKKARAEGKPGLSPAEEAELRQLEREEAEAKGKPFDPDAYLAKKKQEKLPNYEDDWLPANERGDITADPKCNIGSMEDYYTKKLTYYSTRHWADGRIGGTQDYPRLQYWLTSWLALLPALIVFLLAKWVRWLMRPEKAAGA